MDGCVKQYCCATELYLLSMLAHIYNIIIDRGVGAPGNFREVLNGLNATKKRFCSMVIPTVKLPGAAAYESHMSMHTSTSNTDISLARAFQKHLSEPTRAHS